MKDLQVLQSRHFCNGEWPYQVEALVVQVGTDWVVVVGGSQRYHTGAVAVGTAHPALKDPTHVESTASVITVTGHKEDQLARQAALTLAKQWQAAVTVTVGIHMDQAAPGDIERLVHHFHQLIEDIAGTVNQ